MLKRLAGIAVAVVLFVNSGIVAVSHDNETYLSEEIQNYCIEIGEMYGICPELLMAIIEIESSGNPQAENKGCVGLMQISERYQTKRMEKLGVTDIHDPYGNILVGTDYIMELIEQNGDEISFVLDIYNGNSKANWYVENGNISRYADKILKRSAELERVHNK